MSITLALNPTKLTDDENRMFIVRNKLVIEKSAIEFTINDKVYKVSKTTDLNMYINCPNKYLTLNSNNTLTLDAYGYNVKYTDITLNQNETLKDIDYVIIKSVSIPS